ncbi:hypothetical protein HanPSC8_Chr05g0193681 [Helianthus annuus]|nr:hypothetical protein HanPSC8_Chr05g0193681 [Helianthus annuus]
MESASEGGSGAAADGGCAAVAVVVCVSDRWFVSRELILVPFGVEGRTVISMTRRPVTANDEVPGTCLTLFPPM